MKNYEKKSFIKIFLGYFISVTIFIVILGVLYYNQQKTFIMQKTAMNMHQFLLKSKQSYFKYKKEGYSIEIVKNTQVRKQLPVKHGNYYTKAFSNIFILKVDAKIIDNELLEIKYFTIMLQIILIIFFALISWVLAKKSIQPMVDTISHLDRFTKDLIHDLNTPITSILLNSKMLKKEATKETLTKINRIENSAKNISSLYENLTLLLDETNLIKNDFNLTPIINELIETYKTLYPNITFIFNTTSIMINSNQNALKRILDNIISNACKYSISTNPTITINFTNNTLTIQDNGKGIKYPQKIFERNYQEANSGYGIGMHIVHRLCSELSIDINIQSEENKGTTVLLKFT